jgi:hypothetical protein
VDEFEEHELRTWADGLRLSADFERRAMGKAILMLLGQIETLRRELEQAQRPTRNTAGGAVTEPDEVSESSAGASDDTATISFRERMRAATRRDH